VAQHKLVVAKFCFNDRVTRDKGAKITRTKWWELKGEAQQNFRDRLVVVVEPTQTCLEKRLCCC
jgi:hypothetical protein